MIKYAFITFTKKIIDDLGSEKSIEHILEAVQKANCNLYLRHNIHLTFIGIVENGFCVSIRDNDDILNKKNVGYHLRGLSLYLTKTYPEIYKNTNTYNRICSYTLVTREQLSQIVIGR